MEDNYILIINNEINYFNIFYFHKFMNDYLDKLKLEDIFYDAFIREKFIY